MARANLRIGTTRKCWKYFAISSFLWISLQGVARKSFDWRSAVEWKRLSTSSAAEGRSCLWGVEICISGDSENNWPESNQASVHNRRAMLVVIFSKKSIHLILPTPIEQEADRKIMSSCNEKTWFPIFAEIKFGPNPPLWAFVLFIDCLNKGKTEIQNR